MDKLKFAVVCHCDNPAGKLYQEGLHKPLYVHDPTSKFYSKLLTSLDYKFIDRFEGCDDWKDINDDSIDSLWAYHCSIEPFFQWSPDNEKFKKWFKNPANPEAKNVFTEIFTEGFRILKPGGQLVIPTDSKTNLDNFINNINENIASLPHWILPTKKTDILPFILNTDVVYKKNDVIFVVCTKPISDIYSPIVNNITYITNTGGKRKTSKKTRKSRHRRKSHKSVRQYSRLLDHRHSHR
jgi:hypothetical protein